MPEYYISITGLKVKSPWLLPTFFYYAIPSSIQARSAPGNIDLQTTYIQGIHHTLSVWKDKKSMLTYLRQGAHLKAMKAFVTIAAFGKIYGYESDTIPTWPEARRIWESQGAVHYGAEGHRASGNSWKVAAISLLVVAISAAFLQGVTVRFRPLVMRATD